VASARLYAKSAPHPRQPRQHPTTQFFTGRMPFLPPNQQRQSTEGKCPVRWPSLLYRLKLCSGWPRRFYQSKTTCSSDVAIKLIKLAAEESASYRLTCSSIYEALRPVQLFCSRAHGRHKQSNRLTDGPPRYSVCSIRHHLASASDAD